MARLDRRCPLTFATTVLAVAIWGMAGAFTPARVGAVPSETTVPRARGALGGIDNRVTVGDGVEAVAPQRGG